MDECPSCKSKSCKNLYKIDEYRIVKCAKCGLVRTKGTKISQYTKYHRDTDYDKYEELFRNTFEKRFKIISKYKKSRKLLDIGASTGTMLQIFMENGWDVLGIEPSKEAATIAKRKGINIKVGYFEKINLKENSFDVVIMNHTFEHVENPVLVLNKIHKVLKKDGIVYIDVPNFGGWDSWVKKSKWKYLMPKEHTYQYTKNSLKKLLERSGLEPIWWGSWSGVFDVDSATRMFILDIKLKRKEIVKDTLLAPFNMITTLVERGSSLAIIGKKG